MNLNNKYFFIFIIIIISNIILFFFLTSCSLLESDEIEKDSNILSYLKINNKYCAIDTEKSEIFFPLDDSIYLNNIEKNNKSNNLFYGLIDFSYSENNQNDDYNFYVNDSLIESGEIFTFNNLSILDTISVMISIKSNSVNHLKNTADNIEEYNLIFTSLPIIMLNSSSIIYQNYKTPADFIITEFSPNIMNDNQLIALKIRGSASSKYLKKSYSIEFRKKDDWNESKNVSLLNLRNDDDWILDAVYLDKTLMRNRISHDIFLDIANQNIEKNRELYWGARGRFVELFLNNTYQGVYVLSERVDKKQLELSDENNSFLFKAIDNHPNPYRKYDIKYPSRTLTNLGLIQEKWDSFIELLDYTNNSLFDDFILNIYDKFDIENIIDYQILLLLTSVSDNIDKNYFIAKKDDQNSGDYKHYFIPWDLDSSFGRHWHGIKYGQYSFHKTFLSERLFEDSNFVLNFKNRWFELREEGNILNYDELLIRFDNYFQLLYSTGAYDRNVKKWPIDDGETYPDNDNYEDDYNYIQFWLDQRLIWLDNNISAL